MMMQSDYHIPVLKDACIDGLRIKPNGVYVDATFGGGGHSRAILNRLSNNGRLIAFDQDQDAVQNTIHDQRFLLIEENFKYLKRYLKYHGFTKVDGILADFGVSSHQFNVPERGFSLRYDADLDMRMDQTQNLTASIILNTYPEEQISKIFREYAELKIAQKLASAIVLSRNNQKIVTTFQFNQILEQYLPTSKHNKFLAKIYQALRIEVNQELEALKSFLIQSVEVLIPKGRLCLLSYHSLEDRLVKHFIRSGNFEDKIEKDFFGNIIKPLQNIGKLVVPDQDEIILNNRSRSAKLRIAEKI